VVADEAEFRAAEGASAGHGSPPVRTLDLRKIRRSHRRASTLLVGFAEGVRAKCGHSARNPDLSDLFPIARGLLQREALLFVKIGTIWMAAHIPDRLGCYLQHWSASPPTENATCLSEIVNSLKGVSSGLLKVEFPEIPTFWSVRKCGGALWSPSYLVGGAPLEIVRQCIENQGRSDPPA
jgi:hypothetical protein